MESLTESSTPGTHNPAGEAEFLIPAAPDVVASRPCEQRDRRFAKPEASGGSPQHFCSPACRYAAGFQRAPSSQASVQPAKSDQQAAAAKLAAHDRFDWFKDDSIVLEEQLPTAIYFSERNHLVIRQRAEYRDEDAFIYIAPQNIAEFIDRLTDVVGIIQLCQLRFGWNCWSGNCPTSSARHESWSSS
jgi:hypothetical protein